MILCDIAKKAKTDKVRFGYTKIYENELKDKRNDELSILEIGVKDGASIKMWKEYFPNSTIAGMDIEDCRFICDERTKFYQYNQGKREDIEAFISEHKARFDVIIDDGSHMQKDIMVSLGGLFPFLNSGGIYFIEDIASREISLRNGKLWGTQQDDFSDSVISVLEKFQRSKFFNSEYLTWSENFYLSSAIKNIKIFYAQNKPLTQDATSDFAVLYKGG